MFLYKVPGFTFTELYNMPVHLRRYYLKEYKEWKKTENEEAQNASDQQQQAYDHYKLGQQNSE